MELHSGAFDWLSFEKSTKNVWHLMSIRIIKAIFPKIFPLKAFFSSSVIKFAVPSAVFKATLPVKPSETKTP